VTNSQFTFLITECGYYHCPTKTDDMTGHGKLDFIGTRHGLHKSDYSFRVEQ